MNELFPAAAAVCGILFSISCICTCIFVCPQQPMNLIVPCLQKMLLRWDSGARKQNESLPIPEETRRCFNIQYSCAMISAHFSIPSSPLSRHT